MYPHTKYDLLKEVRETKSTCMISTDQQPRLNASETTSKTVDHHGFGLYFYILIPKIELQYTYTPIASISPMQWTFEEEHLHPNENTCHY